MKILELKFKFVIILLLPIQIDMLSKKNEDRKTYIVHMDKPHKPEIFINHHDWYSSSLESVSSSPEMIYTYDTVINGFSAMLTEKEAKRLKGKRGILSLIPEQRYELQTTRTPEFLGLERSERLLPASTSESDVIVGVLDSGVWPESKSFDDTGLGPVPRSWRGECQEGVNFTKSNCNRKLIGARFFHKGYEAMMWSVDDSSERKSPRDDDGHGTHTASTAAGSPVPGASLFGYASGLARGMAPRARVAIYKVCWLGGCFGSDILAGMEKAIEDGVHVMSMSIGGFSSYYYLDVVAIGAFSAMKKGIFVSCAAGNDGPYDGTVANVYPWVTTVGAGTVDRDFPAYVVFGNGKNFSGVSVYSGKPISNKLFSIVYARNASKKKGGKFCLEGHLDPKLVSGKIVVCDRGTNSRVDKGEEVKRAGGLGMILANSKESGEELIADAFLIPEVSVGYKTGHMIKRIIKINPIIRATLVFSGTKLGVEPSPVVGAFSSRGPNLITPKILKPDLIAPGVNILAAWTGKAGPTGLDTDTRRVNFNIVSGTSMSCPHVSGLAALVKAAHPDWSPAAIRSALMTTAYITSKTSEPILDSATGLASTPFDYGSGHVNPVSAIDPGLIYDTTIDNYLDFLCALNYSPNRIKHVTGKNFTCSPRKRYRVQDLNYPSFAAVVNTTIEKSKVTNIRYARTVTNVGKPGTYKVSISSQSSAVKITVEPESLSFSTIHEKKSFIVTIAAHSMPPATNKFGRLTWSHGTHRVSSPIAVSWI